MDQIAMSKKSHEVMSNNNDLDKNMYKNKTIELAMYRRKKTTIKMCACRFTCQPESKL